MVPCVARPVIASNADAILALSGGDAIVKGSRLLLDGSPSSRGLGRGPFKAETRVRIPVGTPQCVRSPSRSAGDTVAAHSTTTPRLSQGSVNSRGAHPDAATPASLHLPVPPGVPAATRPAPLGQRVPELGDVRRCLSGLASVDDPGLRGPSPVPRTLPPGRWCQPTRLTPPRVM